MCRILAAQQHLTGYPLRWPLPYPVEDFVVRREELAAWVAVVDDEVAGHVSACAPVLDDVEVVDVWTRTTGLTADRLGTVGVLVVDTGHLGRGVGAALLDTVEGWLVEQGLQPVLEVLTHNERALALYLRRGWQVVGSARPAWLPPDQPPAQLLRR